MNKNMFAAGFAASFCLIIQAGPAPVVSNVRVSQDSDTRIVKIKYDLAECDAVITIDLQTNAVAGATEGWTSIGGRHMRSLSGAVNRMMPMTNDLEALWLPDVDWPDRTVASGCFRAVVKAWGKNAPPDYWAIDISGGKCHFYYPDEESLPEGIDSDRWRMEQMLMRRIRAKNVVWEMGSPEDEVGRDKGVTSGANMEMLHKVKLTNDYYIGVFEVTQYQMEIARVGSKNESKFTNSLHWATRPAEYTDFADRYHDNTDPTDPDPAVRHRCESWKVTGKLRELPGLDHYFDLPREAQWEYACRAGSTSALYDGNNLAKDTGADENLSKLARYKYTVEDQSPAYDCDTKSGTARVGSYEPNAWGLYDMLGNVSEMCLDCYSSYTNVTEEITVDPFGTKFYGANASNDTRYRVARGGNYSSAAGSCRCASRGSTQVWAPASTIGARMCYTLVNDDVDVEGDVSESEPLGTALVSVGGAPSQSEGGTVLRCVPHGGRVTVR